MATDNECGADEYKTGVSEGGRLAGESEGFKEEVDERGNGICLGIGISGNGVGREEILRRGEMGVRIGGKVFSAVTRSE